MALRFIRTERHVQQKSPCALSALEAPAGYGKTTAIRSILRDSETPVYWYTAVELGLMNGYLDGTFQPGNGIRLCEVIKLAATVNNIYYGGSMDDVRYEHQDGQNVLTLVKTIG